MSTIEVKATFTLGQWEFGGGAIVLRWHCGSYSTVAVTIRRSNKGQFRVRVFKPYDELVLDEHRDLLSEAVAYAEDGLKEVLR